MAKTNNAVTLTAGLSCSILSSPAVGTAPISASLAYTDGDPASDSYIAVGTSSTPLNTDLNGDGYVLVTNPGPSDVDILVGSTPLGTLHAGSSTSPTPMMIPVADGVIINATVASGTQVVGVTAIAADAND